MGIVRLTDQMDKGLVSLNIYNYRKVSNIRRTKSQNLNASRLIL